MRKEVLAAANCYLQKYFFSPDFDAIPNDIKKEIRIITVCMAQKLHCVFSIGFYDDGSVFLETNADENDFEYDEIGAGLEIAKIRREEAELLQSLSLWYIVSRGKNR